MRLRFWISLIAFSTIPVIAQCVPDPTEAAADAKYGTVEGVVRDPGGDPVAFVNVIVLGTRQGTQTDQKGRFRLTGIPPGDMTIRIQALGYQPLTIPIRVEPGQTLRLEDRMARIPPPPKIRWSEVRLPKRLAKRIKDATDLRVVRVDPNQRAPDTHSDSVSYLADSRVIREADSLPAEWRLRLVRLLEDRRLYLANALHAIYECGGFSPGVVARFRGRKDVTDLVICYKCGEFYLKSSDGLRKSGHFDRRGADFLQLAREAFPRDSVLAALDPARYGSGLTDREIAQAKREHRR